jgi:hypothetical protein
MKSIIGIAFLSFLILMLSCDDPGVDQTLSYYQPREGDILFQSLENRPLVEMIKGISNSQYAHCGIVEKKNSSWFVIEPFPQVKETRLEKFIGRGVGRTVDAYRLKDEYQEKIPELLDTIRTFFGRPYDFQFELDEKKVYCSELIYTCFKKVYGDTLGQVKALRDMNWRPYKGTIRLLAHGQIPMDRLIISPRALSEATQLNLVYKGMKTNK